VKGIYATLIIAIRRTFHRECWPDSCGLSRIADRGDVSVSFLLVGASDPGIGLVYGLAAAERCAFKSNEALQRIAALAANADKRLEISTVRSDPSGAVFLQEDPYVERDLS
jgi:hypothetical protein